MAAQRHGPLLAQAHDLRRLQVDQHGRDERERLSDEHVWVLVECEGQGKLGVRVRVVE